MREELLHFIWRSRYFNHRELTTEAGEPIFVHYPGNPNTDQGPDFKNACITIGNTRREGPVELHIRASDWHRHTHTGDPHYEGVILHVVWDNDTHNSPAGIPILALCDRIPKLLVPRYEQFMARQSFVPCERLLSGTIPRTGRPLPADIEWAPFRHSLLSQRLDHRTAFIRSLIDEKSPHWEQTLFLLIARSLGQPVNADAFLSIAKRYPLSFLLRRRTDPAKLENLFLEQANRLDQPLSFSRMRPANSPYVRLRQLAGLLTHHPGWFTLLLELDYPAAALRTIITKGLGTQTRHSILINAFIPMLYAYGVFRQEPRQREKALRWLESTPPEDNTIIRGWQKLGLPTANAADTQALLELKKNFCAAKKCLDCTIGQALLTETPAAQTPTPRPASI